LLSFGFWAASNCHIDDWVQLKLVCGWGLLAAIRCKWTAAG
jgi:hypothetical protein